MAQRWCASWRTQHGCVLPALIRTDDLRREEFSINGDANATLPGAAISVLQAPGMNLVEWEGRILDWFGVHQEPLLVSVSFREQAQYVRTRSS